MGYLQVQQLQHSLQGCQTQVNILTDELQHKCQQLDTLSQSHKALLSRFQELTVLMSEAHNKLNAAVAKSSKAIAASHTKVRLNSLTVMSASVWYVFDLFLVMGSCYVMVISLCGCAYVLHHLL